MVVMADDAAVAHEKEIVRTTPPTGEEVVSGLGRMMSNMNKNLSRPVEEQKPVVPKAEETTNVKSAPKADEVVYDYSMMKDVSDEDYTKVDEYLDGMKLKENKELRYRLITKEDDVKKQQRLAQARFDELEKLKKSNPNEELTKYNEFVTDLKKDFIGTYRRYQEDFDLPDISFVQKQFISGGDTESRLEGWQSKELVPAIEKKFKLGGDEFVYDSADGYKAGTPSYEYRTATEKKEKEFNSEYQLMVDKEKEVLNSITVQRNDDLKHLRETFFPDASFEGEDAAKKADETFVSFLNRIDDMYDKMKKGEITKDSNPFALRNVFRGIFFDELHKKLLVKRETDIHSQYNKLGLYLPDEGSAKLPTDATKTKGDRPFQSAYSETELKRSPFKRSLNRVN